MGSWNGTCAVSNLHITAGQRVAVFMLAENKDKKTFCYGNALYDVLPVPFYGKYNNHGGAKDCEGFGVDIVVDAIKSKLYEFGQGPNEYRDCTVKKDNFNLDKLFGADHEGRLGIHHHSTWDGNAYQRRELENLKNEQPLTSDQQFELDRLCAKLAQVDTFRRVTHVIIHGDVFDAILKNHYIEQYTGADKGNTGYDNSYIHIYFKDLIESIPAYVDIIKSELVDEHGIPTPKWYRMRLGRDLHYNCIAMRWMSYFGNGRDSAFGVIDVDEKVNDYCDVQDWDGLAKFVHEVLTAAWINSFMTSTRKIWTKQAGMGSQNNDPEGYILLANTVLDILKAEKEEYDREYGYEE